MKIKKNDTVIVLSGKDKGKKGTVLRAMPAEGKVIVEGVHILKKVVKAKARGEKSIMVEKPYPITVSKIALVDPKTGTSTRVGYKTEGDKKIRIARKSNQAV
jgi:large subunit ribosomal protein L24